MEEEALLNSLDLFQSAITLLLLVCSICSTYYHLENSRSRHTSYDYLVFRTLIKCTVVIAAPNVWWGGRNLLLHLALLGRVFFPIIYYVRATLYYSPRAARIIHLYGIKPELTFEFAWKVILNNMGVG